MSLQSFVQQNKATPSIKTTAVNNSIVNFKKNNITSNVNNITSGFVTDVGQDKGIIKDKPKKKKTFWGWLSKQLMKPVGIVSSEAEALGKFIGKQFVPEPTGVTEEEKKIIKKALSDGPYIPGKEAVKVLVGKKESSFTELWSGAADSIGMNKGVATSIGFVGDLVADPLNFIGVGLTSKGKIASKVTSLNKAGKTVKAGSRLSKTITKLGLNADDLVLGATRAEQVAKGQRALVNAMGKPVFGAKKYYEGLDTLSKATRQTKLAQGLRKVFTTKTGIKELDNMTDAYNNLSNFKKEIVMDKAIDIQKTIVKMSPDEIKMIAEVIEKPAVRNTIKNADILKVADNLDAMFKEMKVTEKAVGVLGTELANYFPHIRAKESLGARIKGLFSPKVYNANLGAAKGRKIPGTLLEIEQQFGKEFFQTNPALAYAQRGLASAKAVSAKQFLDDVGKKFFVNAESAPLGYAASSNPLFKGLKAPREVAEAVDKYIVGIQPEEVKVMVKAFDGVQNWWKGQVLISPSYHTRNMVGNFWNNWLAGVQNPIRYEDARKLQSEKLRQGFKLVTDYGDDITGDVLFDAARKQGVVGRGLYSTEIAEQLGDVVGGTTKRSQLLNKMNPLKQENALFKLNRKIGSAIEDNARLAHFIDKVKAGHSFDDAAKSVKKFLFDYGDLTHTEKVVFKRVAPFYTWTRKNIPLQIENMITQPAKFSEVPKAIQAIESFTDAPDGEKYMSNYISDNIPVRIRTTKEGNTEYFLLGNWLPSAQAIDFLSRPFDNMVNMLTPLLKTPYELWANKSFFFENTLGEPANIENYYKQPTEFVGLPMRKKAAHLMRNIRILNDINKFTGTSAADEPENSWIIDSLNVLFGKAATFNTDSAKYFYNKDTQDRVSELKAAINKAYKDNNIKQAQKLSEELSNFLFERNQ